MSIRKPRGKVAVSRYRCPVEGCDVSVYIAYDKKHGHPTVTDFRCDRQDECAIPFYDPCPLYIDLVENRDIRHIS